MKRTRLNRSAVTRRRVLAIETLDARRLLASDLACQPFVDSTANQPIATTVPPLFGPVLDFQQLQHIELPNKIRLDNRGLAYTYLPSPASDGVSNADSMQASGEGAGGGPGTLALNVPVYHSKPNATKKIYLDFDGELVSGTFWNNQNYTGNYNTGAVINAPPYSIDSNLTSFTDQELTVIREVWAQMAEDFAPFQVDVTTEYPGDAIFRQGSQAIRALISTDTDATSNTQWFPGAGGVAYLNSWTFTDGSPVWVFYNRLGTSNAKNIAEAASHEVGHSYNLEHDGRISPSETYYRGHGSGQTGWAPIMGSGYSKALTQWSRGEYPNANRTQDDLAIISGYVPYEPDDHSGTAADATALTASSKGEILGSGLITTRTDKDAFRFTTQTGSVTLEADPFELATGKANLDVQLTLLDGQGNSIAVVNDVATLNATLTTNLSKGTYTAIIDGVGKAANGSDFGYSDYASIGWFTLSGTVVPNSSPVIDTSQSFVVAYEGDSITNSGTWLDANIDDTVTLTASVGTVVKAADGTWTWSMPTTDQFTDLVVTITGTDDLGAVGTKTFTASAENRPPALLVNQPNVVGNVLSTLTNGGTWNDVTADTVTLSASLGSVTKNSDGTWSWSFVTDRAYASETVTITGSDEDGGSSQVQFTIDALVATVGSKVYYKGSSFADTSVEAALDPSKVVIRSGAAPQALSFANLINTSRGINGLVFDIAGLAASSLTASDFVFRMSPTGSFDGVANPPSAWATAPSPNLIDVTPGTATVPARVRIEWVDNAIANRWLQIKILANANTGLTTPQVYYLGHLQGETNGSIEAGGFLVRTTDVSTVAAAIGQTVTVGSVLDLTKDGRIRTTDISATSSRVGQRLTRITIPAAGSGGEGEGGLEPGVLVAFAMSPLKHNAIDGRIDTSQREIRARLTDQVFSLPLPLRPNPPSTNLAFQPASNDLERDEEISFVEEWPSLDTLSEHRGNQITSNHTF